MKAKEAIKIIGDWISEETHKRKYNKTEIVELSEALISLKCITEQQDNRWIPVSDRLPEKSDVYLATFLEEGKRYVERFYYSDFMGWMMPVAWQDEGRIENIIAWQSLPPAWKGESVG